MKTNNSIEKIYRENYIKVFTFIYNTSNDWHLSEEITQETFIKAYKNISSFRGEAKITVWLNRIAYNIFIDHKRKKVNQEYSLDENTLNNLMDTGKNLLKQFDQKLMSECIQKQIMTLSEIYRAPLILDMQGYSKQEIAEILNCTRENAKVRLHRAKKKMKDILGKSCNFYYDDRNILC